MYEIIKCDVISEGQPVWVRISIGREKSERQHAKPVSKGDKYWWKWKQAARQVPAMIEMSFPVDLSQIPDIFLDFYTDTTFTTNYRFAYIRLPIKTAIHSNDIKRGLFFSISK